ncbi:MAG: hypothetical protein H0U97_08585 [Gammaproteobacteria bacterium]|nr:hypothetical protein [Gammaproteobacteria bacterium]
MTTKFIFEAEPFDSYVPYPRFEEIPLFDQPEEVDLFLGGLVRSVAGVAKDVGRTAQRAAQTIGRTATQVSRVVPLSQVADLASRMTPFAFLGGKASAPPYTALTIERPK